MPPRQIPTADLPARLDALDDKIHDLLIRRAQLTGAMTPAEQAKTLRRLAARNKGGIPLAVLVRIWRELTAAAAPPGRTVHVYAADRIGQFRDLARDLFGSVVAMKASPSASSIVHECTNDPLAFGVVPPPESDETARAWWAQLTPSGQAGPRIVAVLPLVGNDQPDAYVIGTLEPEASGDDSTLLLIEANENVSLTGLQSLLKQGDVDARLLAVSRDSAGSSARHHLFQVAGFIRDDDSRFGRLLEQAGESVLRVATVGSYANPFLRVDYAL